MAEPQPTIRLISRVEETLRTFVEPKAQVRPRLLPLAGLRASSEDDPRALCLSFEWTDKRQGMLGSLHTAPT
jgi:hypothetical protein